MRNAWRLSLLVFAVSGCDSADPPTQGGTTGQAEEEGSSEVTTGDEDGSVSSGPSGTSETPGGDSIGTSDGDADPSSGESSSSGADGGSTSQGEVDPPPEFATPHFPLQVGMQWSYRRTRVDGSTGGTCLDDGSIHVTTVEAEQGGVFAFTTVAPGCAPSEVGYRIRDAFVDVYNGEWYQQLLLPPERGATWPAGGASGAAYSWDQYFATHTVEAGTFEDCWRRTQSGYDVWEIYCRDVGMVESHYLAWGGDTRSELVEFSY